ncbi:MAG: hypothetical protein RLZZ387_4512 [Chloroflexota bacterium]|jgi:hypothetical protein
MKRHILGWIACGVGLAIVALLAYSLDRTAWLFRLYESGQPHAEALGLAAAIVIELAAVALIAGEGVAESLTDDLQLQRTLRAWAGRGLAAVLGVQIVANLVAGYLRGGHALLNLLGEGWAALLIASISWLLANALIPALIFILAKIEAHLLRLALAEPRVLERGATGEQPSTVCDGPIVSYARPAEVAVVQSGFLSLESSAEAPQVFLATRRAARSAGYTCPGCGAELSLGQYGSAVRRGYCRTCKPAPVAVG